MILLLGSLGALGSILGATLGTAGDTCGIEGATHNVIAHTGEVLHTTTAHHHDAVLLQIVTLTS